MKEQIRYEDQLTDSQPAAPIVELFHMVQSLIPEGQQVATIPPNTRVAEAIELTR